MAVASQPGADRRPKGDHRHADQPEVNRLRRHAALEPERFEEEADRGVDGHEDDGGRGGGLLGDAEVQGVHREDGDVHAGAGDAREHAAALVAK